MALYVLQFAVAAGINAFVTSGSQEKIEQAKKLGAKGGVNYKNGKRFALPLPLSLCRVILIVPF